LDEKYRINLAIVSANNHYAGFGPETANTFRKMMDLPEVTWKENKNMKQKVDGNKLQLQTSRSSSDSKVQEY
jgi:hypothetical protein